MEIVIIIVQSGQVTIFEMLKMTLYNIQIFIDFENLFL